MTKAVTFFECDVDYCSRTYGVAPCTAAIGVTGSAKCLNTRKTCQDIANYADVGATLRFAVNSEYLPRDIDSIPNINEIKFTPAIVSLGQDLGQRASLDVTFHDHRHPDTGAGFDKYVAERTFNPFAQGSFWPKFRARHPFLQDRASRLIRGYLGQTLAGMETRHYVIESIDGPDPAGTFRIVSKDILKLADGEKAQAPAASNGRLLADINTAVTRLTVTPAGIAAEYPLTGYLNIGGSEIVSYARTVDAVLLVHGEGTDASTTIIDSAGGKTITVAGNTQIDTAQFKFGASSVLFDGAGDDFFIASGSADPDFAFGTGDFTIDLWLRPTANLNRMICDFRNNLTDVALGMYLNASGQVVYDIANVAKITTAAVIANNAWTHVALTRSGGNARLFVGGTQSGSTYVGSENLIQGAASRPVFGLRTDSGLAYAGWMDEIRIVKGVAKWTANFTPPTAPYGDSLADYGDVMSIVRAQLNTVAATHNADDRLQLVLRYVGVNPADIISDLLQTYAGVPSSYIPLSSWLAEVGAFLGNVYTANIPEPTSVNALVSELIEQAALAIWWDDAARLIRLQVLRAIPASAQRVTSDNMIFDSLDVKEQPERRLSRVLTYFAQINPLKNLDQLDNYKGTLLTIDSAAEADYESAALKKIFSRWIPFGGRTIAARLNNVFLARYRDAPRLISYKLLRYSEQVPSLGGGYNISAWCFQDALGNLVDVPVEVISLNPDDAYLEVEAEEMRFAGAPVDPNTHTIIIDSNAFDINLRTMHDSLFGTPVAGNSVVLIVQEGVIIGSTAGGVALDIGTWPSVGSPGITITIQGTGRIQGKGGDGGGTDGRTEWAAQPGGTALFTRRAISLDMTGGKIWAGGGGGGHGSMVSYPSIVGAGGSGGQGQTPGGVPATAILHGYPGTTESPGPLNAPGGNTYPGGAGGAPGAAGGTGFGVGAQGGGAGGAAIDGVSFVTTIHAPNIQGSQIN